MNKLVAALLISASAFVAPSGALGATSPAGGYHQVDAIGVPDVKFWDYATVEPESHRLYVGRAGGLLSVDLATKSVTPFLLKSPIVHSVALLPGGNTAAAAAKDKVVLFDDSTGAVLANVVVGKGPDSIFYESKSGLVAVTNEDSGTISLIDPVKQVAVGDIGLGGTPEAVTGDGRGVLYDNLEDKRQVVFIDVARRKIFRRVHLPQCDRPTGIAYDDARHMVISACHNGGVNIVNTETGRVTGTLKVGAGPDTVFADSKRGVVLVPSGVAGQLNVIKIGPDGRGRTVQVVATQPSARTGAVDPVSGYLYIPAAKLTNPKDAHSIVAGSFKILVFAPN